MRLFGCCHALCRVLGQHIGFAGHESGEGERGIEPDRASETGITDCAGCDGDHAGVEPVIGRAAAIVEHELRQLAAARMNRDADLAHFAAHDFPGKLQPVMEPVIDPIR